jgi:hypothetical protein
MDRRLVSGILWTLLFAAGVLISSRIPPGRKASIGEVLGFGQAARQVQQQVELTPEERARQTPVPGVAPAVAASPTVAPRVEEVLAMLREDRICDFMRAKADESQVLQALVLDSQSPMLQQLFGPRGPMAGVPDFNSRDEIILFYNALLYGGLLLGAGTPSGVTQVASDPGYAEKLFQELESRDPANGAYFYFHAGLLARVGRPAQEQRQLLIRAIHTLKFNTFLPLIVAEFRKGVSANATSWFATMGGLSKIPFPSFPRARDLSALLAPEPQAVHDTAIDFGFMLIKQPQALQIERISGAEFVRGSWSRVYPREPVPDLQAELKVERDTQEEGSALQQALAGLRAQPCDRRAFNQYYSKHRGDALPYR